jgi:hypothetical protein
MHSAEDAMLQDTHTYRIRVEGHLDASWSDRLGGLAIETSSEDGNTIISTLTGQLPDQSALSGVLNALVDLHHALISVKRVDSVETIQ